eukprot:g16315.t1
MAKSKWLAPVLALAAVLVGSGSLQFVSPLTGPRVLGTAPELGRGSALLSDVRPTNPFGATVGPAVLCVAALALVAGKAQRSVCRAIPNPHVIPVVDLSGKKIGEEELQFQTFSKQTANYVVHQALQSLFFCVVLLQKLFLGVPDD